MVGLIGRVTTIAVAALGSLLLIGTGIAAAGTQPGQLDPGDTLYPGQSIVSPNGQWSLEMQTDGNLVLYAPRHSAIAESRTAGEPEVILQMQRDGNLVLRAKGNRPIAASSTEDHPGTVLQVQDDGGVVLYAPGHQALRVVVPAADFVNTPMPGQPAPVDSPKPDSQGDPGAVAGMRGKSPASPGPWRAQVAGRPWPASCPRSAMESMWPAASFLTTAAVRSTAT